MSKIIIIEKQDKPPLTMSPGRCSSVVRVSAHALKGCKFYSLSNIPGFDAG